MKYSIVTTLAAAALLAGCIRPPDIGGGGQEDAERFILDFSPVRSVIVDSWNVPPQPISNNAGGGSTVRIEGTGTVQTPWTNASGAAYPTPVQNRNISLSYAFTIDNGCKGLAEQAQQEGRTLHVEGFGTVAELAAAMLPACYPSPLPPQTGGQLASAIACPPPPTPTPVDGSAPENPTLYRCGCQQPPTSFVIKADKLVSCSLGGNVILPPQPL